MQAVSRKKNIRGLALTAAMLASLPVGAMAEPQMMREHMGAMAGSQMMRGMGVLTLTGEASVNVAPDLATVSIGVTTNEDTAAKALAANTEAMTKVIGQLKSAGIEESDIQTSSLSIGPVWADGVQPSKREISGYSATNMVTVRVRNLDNLGPVLDASVADGANALNGLGFELAEPQPALDQARKLAVEDAKRKAQLIADAAGVTLGPIMSIREGGDVGGVRPMAAQFARDSVPVQAGEINYSSDVTITWRIGRQAGSDAQPSDTQPEEQPAE